MSALGSRFVADLRIDSPFAVGDVVATGTNSHPKYRLIAVTDDRAWIRDIQHGTDHVVPVASCRKFESDGA